MPARRFYALDGWRGVAATMVALYHFPTDSSVSATTLVHNSWLFVDCFFLLSGFVIAANYRERFAQGYRVDSFMLLRWGRLYPLHLVILVLFVISEAALSQMGGGVTATGREPFTGDNSPLGILTSLLLVQAMGIHEGQVWNTVAWSISTEFWMYAIYALCAVWFARRIDGTMVVLMVLAAFFLAVVPSLPEFSSRFIDMARCMYAFALGALIHSLYVYVTKHRSLQPGATAMAFLEFAAVAVALSFLSFLPEKVHVWAPLAFFPLVLVFSFDAGPVSRLLRTPPFALLGLVSYSIYMWHPLMQSRVMMPAALLFEKLTSVALVEIRMSPGGVRARVWGFETWQGDLWTFAMLAFLVATSWLLYRWIEAPARDRVRGWVSRRREVA